MKVILVLMEDIARLRAEQFKVQRDELARRLTAQCLQREADTPLLNANIHAIYSQLSQMARIDAPGPECVQWNDEQMTRWLSKDFLRGITRCVLELSKESE